jgi:guanylate kinase
VGKSTVVAGLRAQRPDIWLSVSVTTRSPRPGEVSGREYHFVSDEAFDSMVARGELLEWAQFDGKKYGTPRAPVAERAAAGVPTLLEIDIQGARQVRRRVHGALLIFLAPPSREELARRLSGRGTEPPDVIARRLDRARQEIEAGREFDITLVNTSVKHVCRQLVTLMTA